MFLEQLNLRLKREKYQIVGRHSAVKKCSWLHQSLVYGRVCYKQKFYGIPSHRCLQMTPSLYFCTLRCLFCWRVQPEDLGLSFDEAMFNVKPDLPELIIDECIKAQRRILTGYKPHPKVERSKWEEALNPNHAAISLTGEPTLYPLIGELIEEFHKRNMTTFLVTNGTNPKALENLNHQPSQLYISIHAPNKEVFNRICRPRIPDAWERLNESLSLLKNFNCPTVLRITLTKSLNMGYTEDYVKLISKAESSYVEVKSYMYVGFSRKRLTYEDMPSHEDVKMFAENLTKLTGYKIVDEARDSRVVLLSRVGKPLKLR
ncbi:MAG: 4-demethylwyosine synthase TYW1 [Candidatus Bathyarchaeota archaeon]